MAGFFDTLLRRGTAEEQRLRDIQMQQEQLKLAQQKQSMGAGAALLGGPTGDFSPNGQPIMREAEQVSYLNATNPEGNTGYGSTGQQLFGPNLLGPARKVSLLDDTSPLAVQRQKELLGQMNPQGALEQLQNRLTPPPPKLTPIGAQGLYAQNADGTGKVVAAPPPDAFKPTNMQRPGTDQVVFARTPEDLDKYNRLGFVPSGTSVPGAKAPAAPKDAATDYIVGPDGSTLVPRPGGSVAMARAQELAKPVLDERKTYNAAATQYATLADLASDDTGASDIGIVYGFFTAQDPNSSVKEGEFDTVGQKMGLQSRVIGQMKSVAQGKGFLTPEVRQQLVDAAGRSIKQRKATLSRSYKDASRAMEPLKVDRKTFLPFSVADVDVTEVRKTYPTAQQDTAGRVFVIKDGKRMYVEVDE